MTLASKLSRVARKSLKQSNKNYAYEGRCLQRSSKINCAQSFMLNVTINYIQKIRRSIVVSFYKINVFVSRLIS